MAKLEFGREDTQYGQEYCRDGEYFNITSIEKGENPEQYLMREYRDNLANFVFDRDSGDIYATFYGIETNLNEKDGYDVHPIDVEQIGRIYERITGRDDFETLCHEHSEEIMRSGRIDFSTNGEFGINAGEPSLVPPSQYMTGEGTHEFIQETQQAMTLRMIDYRDGHENEFNVTQEYKEQGNLIHALEQHIGFVGIANNYPSVDTIGNRDETGYEKWFDEGRAGHIVEMCANLPVYTINAWDLRDIDEYQEFCTEALDKNREQIRNGDYIERDNRNPAEESPIIVSGERSGDVTSMVRNSEYRMENYEISYGLHPEDVGVIKLAGGSRDGEEIFRNDALISHRLDVVIEMRNHVVERAEEFAKTTDPAKTFENQSLRVYENPQAPVAFKVENGEQSVLVYRESVGGGQMKLMSPANNQEDKDMLRGLSNEMNTKLGEGATREMKSAGDYATVQFAGVTPEQFREIKELVIERVAEHRVEKEMADRADREHEIEPHR